MNGFPSSGHEAASAAWATLAGSLAAIPEEDGQEGCLLLFRDDDVGPVDARTERLIRLFQVHGLPLSLAVVPAWLDRKSAAWLRRLLPDDDQWCLHQHGWRHVDRAPAGEKKNEFPDAVPVSQALQEIRQGRDQLHRHLGDRWDPLFTPPWNRCRQEVLAALAGLGYQAVSLAGTRPGHLTGGLPRLDVTVDLHTRKEPDPAARIEAMAREIEHSRQRGYLAFMLHHERMAETDFLLLDRLLGHLAEHREAYDPVTLAALARRAAPPHGPVTARDRARRT